MQALGENQQSRHLRQGKDDSVTAMHHQRAGVEVGSRYGQVLKYESLVTVCRTLEPRVDRRPTAKYARWEMSCRLTGSRWQVGSSVECYSGSSLELENSD